MITFLISLIGYNLINLFIVVMMFEYNKKKKRIQN